MKHTQPGWWYAIDAGTSMEVQNMAVIEVIWARRTGGASRVAPVGGVAFQ